MEWINSSYLMCFEWIKEFDKYLFYVYYILGSVLGFLFLNSFSFRVVDESSVVIYVWRVCGKVF